MKTKNITFAPLVSLILFVVAVSLVFIFTSPLNIVAYIGIQNGYVLLFVVTFIAGVSTFTSIPYQVILVALAAGGLNPFFLGLVATVGDMLGDSTSYFLGYWGRALLPEDGKWIQKCSVENISFHDHHVVREDPQRHLAHLQPVGASAQK